MKCIECGKAFLPSKYKPSQKYCSSRCRRKARMCYKRAYDRLWRSAHPEYMKEYLRAYRAL